MNELEVIVDRLNSIPCMSFVEDTKQYFERIFLDKYGISVLNSDGSYRYLYDILCDCHEIYPSLSEDGKEDLQKIIAGTRETKFKEYIREYLEG